MGSYHCVRMDRDVRLSPRCEICGDVSIGAGSSVFSGSQIRGDMAPVSIGSRTNVQENCVLHVSHGAPLRIGDDVTIGHGATVHGCKVDDNVLVGMGSIILDGAHISSHSVVAAGALVTGGKEFPPKSMIMGSPARAVRELSDDEVEELISRPAASYVAVSASMLAEGLMLEPGTGDDIWPRS